jgi:hypothetical protein
MFRIKYAILLFVLALLAGCSGTTAKTAESAAVTVSAVSDTAPSQSMAAASNSAPGSTQAAVDAKPTNDIDKAVSNALLSGSHGPAWFSECSGEGHYIMDSKTEGTTVTVYLLAMDGQYGFEDGNFVKVSGSGVIPTVITFSLDTDGNYTFVDKKMPDDGALYTSSIKKLFPKALQDQCLHTSADTGRIKDLAAQEQKYAAVYLKSIGREAVIGEYRDFPHPLLTDFGVSVEVANMMISNKYLSNFPFWVGNREYIEDGVRYIYQVEFDKASHKIIYSKLAYDTKTVSEKLVFDASNGAELPQ